MRAVYRMLVAAALAAATWLVAPSAQAAVPAAPTGIAIARASDGATITWKPSTGATSYTVCLLASGTTNTCSVKTRPTTYPRVTFGGLKPTTGRDWFVRITASNSSGSVHSARIGFDLDTDAPNTPVATVKPTADGAVVTWNATARTSSYTLCLFPDNTPPATCYKSIVNVRGTTYTIRGLNRTDGVDWYLHLYAVGPGGTVSAPQRGWELSGLPTTPTITSIVPTGDGGTITWSPSAGATSYSVCLYGSGTTTVCSVTSPAVTTTSWRATGLLPTGGTDWFAAVTAINADGRVTSDRRGFDLDPATSRPAAPTGASVFLTWTRAIFSWTATEHATSYTVCLRATDSAGPCEKESAPTTELTTTFTGLPPTEGTDYTYVVRAHNANGTTDSVRAAFNLPAAVPTGLKITASSPTSLTVAWLPGTNSERTQVRIATDDGLTQNVSTQTVTDTVANFTGLKPAQRYHVAVRGDNAPALSAWSTRVTRKLGTPSFPVKVVTFNLCGQDKCRSGANSTFLANVPTWAKRKPIAGAWVRSFGADIISTQESGDADTNFITELPGYARTTYKSGKSLFYRTSKFTSARAGWIQLDSDGKRFATWAELVDRTTQSRIIAVDPHLTPYKGKSYDDKRAAETKALIAKIAALNPKKLAVVYAGDFNSNKSNADQDRYPGGYDAPAKVFGAAGIIDSYNVAKSAGFGIDLTWNSANQGIVSPLMHSDHVDHVYVTNSAAVTAWQIAKRATKVDGVLRYVTPFASDHNPLLASFLMPGLAPEA